MNTILEVFEHVCDVTTFNVERIDPHLEHSLLLTGFGVVLIEHFGGSIIFLSWGQSWAVVEQLGTEDQVEFRVTLLRIKLIKVLQ